MNTSINSERLAAYVDGELAPEERASIEAHLATSPEDRAAVEGLRLMNDLLAAAYEAPHRAPLSPGLHRVLVAASRRSPKRRWTTVAGMALAASIVVAVGAFLGERPAEVASNAMEAGPLASESALHSLLESAPAGGTAQLTGGIATLVSTFLDNEERPCREFEMTNDAATFRTSAVACRADAVWTLEFAISQSSKQVQSRDAFVPAAGLGQDAVGAYLEALGAGPVLAPDEEENLIERRWRNSLTNRGEVRVPEPAAHAKGLECCQGPQGAAPTGAPLTSAAVEDFRGAGALVPTKTVVRLRDWPSVPSSWITKSWLSFQGR